MELKNFQLEAKDRLLKYSKEIFDDDNKGLIVFKSPTGSGKTFTMSNVIKDMATSEEFADEDLCFLWVSIGKGNLHKQSYIALVNFFDTYPSCHLLEEEFIGGRNKIQKNEVVVFNWEKLNNKDKETSEWSNVLMKDKETNNFRDIINNTKEAKRKIILIIDESHASTKTERAEEIKNIIEPVLTIEMSATPTMTPTIEQSSYTYTVKPDDVINEGLIKKEIIINENIDKISNNEIDSEQLILEATYKKHQELKQAYKEINSDINPLILIQLPNKNEEKRQVVEDFFKKKNISIDIGNLAIWLSEDKVNTEISYLKPNNSNVDVLLFKQAIDTGWDCPRAQILVKFRESKNIVFEIQTVGRILRMPEAEHYENDLLNRGFVYTNFKSIDILREVYNPNIIKTFSSKRDDNIYCDISLTSYYKHRISYNDITSSFYKVFENVFCNFLNLTKENKGMHLENQPIISEIININNLNNKYKIPKNKKIDSKELDKKIHVDGDYNIKQSALDRKMDIEKILESELGGYAKVRSLSPMKQALYRVFYYYLTEEQEHIENIIIDNKIKIKEMLNTAVSIYGEQKKEDGKLKAKSLANWYDDWQIPKTKNYNPHVYSECKNKLSLYQPCFLQNNMSKGESAFIQYLEKEQKDKILWWWKNGDEHMSENFGIHYGDTQTFQPDFIILFKDKSIGIYEIKDKNDSDANTNEKAEALQKYIEEENSKGKKIKGGIIIKDGDYFKVNNQEKYNRYEKQPTDWNNLSF